MPALTLAQVQAVRHQSCSNYAAPQWNVHPNPGIGYSLWLSLAPCRVYSSFSLLLWVATERALDTLACEKHACAEAETQRMERYKNPFDKRLEGLHAQRGCVLFARLGHLFTYISNPTNERSQECTDCNLVASFSCVIVMHVGLD